MAVLLLNVELLKPDLTPVGNGATVENPLSSEFDLWDKIAGRFANANTPGFRSQWEPALIRGGGRVPPKAERSNIRVAPSDPVLRIRDGVLKTFLDMRDDFGFYSEVIDIPRTLELTAAQFGATVPNIVPNWEAFDDETGASLGAKTWEQWVNEGYATWEVDAKTYFSSSAGTSGGFPLCGSVLLALRETGAITNALENSDAPPIPEPV